MIVFLSRSVLSSVSLATRDQPRSTKHLVDAALDVICGGDGCSSSPTVSAASSDAGSRLSAFALYGLLSSTYGGAVTEAALELAFRFVLRAGRRCEGTELVSA
jgi:hypothetical protein